MRATAQERRACAGRSGGGGTLRKASCWGSARHLLRLYCEHACFRAEVQGLIDRTPIERMVDPDTAPAFEAMLKARDRETKALVSLATRLRLTNQARYTPQAAGTAGRQHASGPRPWEDSPAAEFFNW